MQSTIKQISVKIVKNESTEYIDTTLLTEYLKMIYQYRGISPKLRLFNGKIVVVITRLDPPTGTRIDENTEIIVERETGHMNTEVLYIY